MMHCYFSVDMHHSESGAICETVYPTIDLILVNPKTVFIIRIYSVFIHRFKKPPSCFPVLLENFTQNDHEMLNLRI